LRELRKGDRAESARAAGIATNISPSELFPDIARSARTRSNLRSIPPITSTGISRSSPSTGTSRGPSWRKYGARSASGNHSRPTLTVRGPSTPFVSEIVEPLVDIFDEGDCIVVIAEVPGAEEASISVELENHTLKLRAGGRYRAYRGEVGLPADVKSNSLAWTLNNGVIELRLKHAKRKPKLTSSRSAGMMA
jgi:HSP20 family molecular chaperone IbpA